jgi:pimeloyl-ACP methyl ester carboxylesterase
VLGPPTGVTDALAGLQDPRFREQVRAALFEMWTTGVDSRPVVDYVRSMGDYGYQHWSRAGRELAASFGREGTPVGALEQLAEAGSAGPTLHAYAQPADPKFLAAQEAYAAAHPWFSVHHLDARSHFPVLETPEQVGDVIEDFVVNVVSVHTEPAPA